MCFFVGRNPKVGLDYFRLDCHLDIKFQLIEAEFGLKGFAVVVKLLQMIYSELGYYCEWNEDVALMFGDHTRLGVSAVSEIVNASIKRGLFDKGMFDKYRILTSHGIQDWYFESVSRRERVDVIREYLLISDDDLPKNVRIKSISVNINPIPASRNTHSTVQDSIEEVEEDARAREAELGDPEWERFVKLYEQNIGLMPFSEYELEDLRAAYEQFGTDIMAEAIRHTALKHTANPPAYLRKVYQGFARADVRTVAQAKAAIAEHEQQYRRAERGQPARKPAKYADEDDFY